MTELAFLLIPLIAAAILSTIRGYRLSARVNVAASFLSLLAAIDY
jgi:hydrogenase-4 component F